jgi:hypothetical protein
MHPSYFEVQFSVPAPVNDWPEEFAILSGYATTGEVWTEERNSAADRALGETIFVIGVWRDRITGFFEDTGHSEPGWAAALDLDAACDLGLKFLQDAIYYVRGDELSVSYCDDRRALVPVGSFRERVRAESGSRK